MAKEPGYADAMGELEEILEELEGDDLDVDVLADRVRRASELIKTCRERITRAEDELESIVTDLDDYDAGDEDDEPDDDEDAVGQ
ncbi:MAG: exodeoxyribonuclease VII small subunit [Actinobacteria bacterium]|nr:exodeoxyribonuclease VII small subunit [Actinomycetota bacterium]